MNRSVARAYCTTRWKLAQRLHKWIIWQLVKATVSSYPSPASAPVIASSIRGTPSPILPWSIKAPDLAQGAELEVAVPNLDGYRVRLAGRGLLLVGIGAETRLDKRHPALQGFEVELVDQACGTSHLSSGGGFSW
jgi:hypothetical protein